MAKKNIEELFDLHREDMYYVTKELSDLTNKMSDNMDKLKSKLSAEDWKCLNDIMELQNAKGGIAEKQVFVYAFSLSTKLFAEGLSNDK